MHTRLFVMASLLILMLTLMACGESDGADSSLPVPTATAEPTATPEATPTPRPTDTPEPEPLGLTRENPVPAGQPFLVPEGWEITILDFVDDAWPQIQAENQFNDPPEAGFRMVMIRVRGKNVSIEDEPADFDADFAFRLVGSANIVYTTFDRSCGVIPDDLSLMSTEVFRGGEVDGNICFQVRQDETGLVLFTEFFLSFDEESRRWFAVQ